MQLIGIYLKTLNNEVSKNLKENWYPFGNFDNFNDLSDYSKIIKQLEKSKSFSNKFFSIDQEEEKKGPSINLNCIVGKNGSGKSTIISILYRILNNLACKLKELFPDYNEGYTPVWAWGVEATLYYELDGKIGYIEIYDNRENDYEKKKKHPYPVKLVYNKKSILKKKYSNDQVLLKNLGKSLFYTVGTNYSLHSNSVIRFNYNEKIEGWLDTIYHKNDGYFTPVVLVPYRDNSTIIDTEKELKLANERVNTLSILLKKAYDSDFIENFYPSKIIYELKTEKEYEKEVKEKFIRVYGNSEDADDYIDLKDAIEKLRGTPEIKDIISDKWSKLLNEKNKFPKKSTVYKNTLLYLTYKTIKMCTYYDKYKKNFEQNDLFHFYEESPNKGKEKLEKIIDNIFIEETDFMNLKIKQCIEFLYTGRYYFSYQKEDHYEIDIDKVKIENLSYDGVFIKLLPPFFRKEFIYKKIKDDNFTGKNEMRISDMSSGEQQILNSLSYAIYHMKNASNNRYPKINSTTEKKQLYSIPYQNMNLIFDEAELYYHPEYQRQFVERLLSLIKRSHFEKDIKSINITIVTHSPFILSDIPNKNILALKEGKREPFNANTLGANIYDLLNNQFFMESAIGSHVESVINEIVKDFYVYQDKKDKAEGIKIKNKYTTLENEFYDTFINQIGDEYLHDTLFDMVNQIREVPFSKRRIKEYEAKIERLRNEND